MSKEPRACCKSSSGKPPLTARTTYTVRGSVSQRPQDSMRLCPLMWPKNISDIASRVGPSGDSRSPGMGTHAGTPSPGQPIPSLAP